MSQKRDKIGFSAFKNCGKFISEGDLFFKLLFCFDFLFICCYQSGCKNVESLDASVLILFIYTNCWSLSIYVSMLCRYKKSMKSKITRKRAVFSYFLKWTEIRSDFRFWFTYDKKNHVSWHVRCSWFCQHFVIFHEHAMNKIIVKVCLLITWPNTKILKVRM